MAAMAKRIVLASLLVAAAVVAASAVDCQLTLQNLCPFAVYPVVTPNYGCPGISNNTVVLEGDGRGLISFPFPSTKWEGHVVARIGCTTLDNCETGMGPPATMVQLVVHSPDAEDLTTYSVSLVQGFNVGVVVSPQFIIGGQCPVLGCPVDLNVGCPVEQQVKGNGGSVIACKGDQGYFKQRCPLTRVNGSDVEPVPQNCLGPRELKVVFCQTTI